MVQNWRNWGGLLQNFYLAYESNLQIFRNVTSNNLKKYIVTHFKENNFTILEHDKFLIELYNTDPTLSNLNKLELIAVSGFV